MFKGAFVKKIVMTQVFTPEGEQIGVTVLEFIPQQILEYKDYPAKKVAKIGFMKTSKSRRQKKPQKGYFDKLKVDYFRRIREVEVIGEAEGEEKKEISMEMFSVGEKVDVRGVSKGKGFQGGMRRHNWSGQPKTHGHTSHRRIGSNGASAYPSKVVKGFTMPGHMGNENVVVKNLRIVGVDKDKNVIFLRGGCPGARGSILFMRKQHTGN